MITTGTRWFLGLGIVAYVLAAAYGWTTGGDGPGPLSMGYKGGVGDHFGYGLLMSAAIVGVFLGMVMSATRDNSARAEAQVAGVAELPPVRPAGVSYWPPLAAFGVALGLIGVITTPLLFIAGLVVVGAALVEWTVQAWADHATGDPDTNRRIRNRLMNPLEVPVFGVLAVGLVLITISRVFLALTATSAVWVATGVAAAVLLAGAVIAARPKLSSNLLVGVAVLAAVAALAAGVSGGLAGERDFHTYDREESHP
jgi:hypothetical protein